VRFDTYSADARLDQVGSVAREAARAGYSAMWFTEAAHNPFLPCALATAAAPEPELEVGTSIAVAFPRSPMVTAQAAWDLADQSQGRFHLGLGTQVKAHVTRRFSSEFTPPVPRMREYIGALRAIFRAFQGVEKLSFSGDYYSFTLLTDFFSPGPIEHPDVPIELAGVNRGLARLAGETCDGFHIHPFHSRRYLAEVVRPAVAEGAARAGRSVDDLMFVAPVFIAVGDTEEEITRQRESARRQLSFYATTPTYASVLEFHGFDDAQADLRRLMAAGDLDAMASVITDAMLDLYVVTSSWSALPRALHERYDGLADRLISYSPTGAWTESPVAAERWAEVVRAVQAP
jgi:probable F420-dependent oxidoreductase